MSIDTVALLAGLLLAPVWLVWLGHGLRQKSGRAHTVFWWAVGGNSIAVIVMCIALFAPPLMWHDATLRALVIHWSLLLGPIAGGLVGVLAARTRC